MIRWTQPEIALYVDNPWIRTSHPDRVEDGGRYFLTETQQDVARVHEVDRGLLEGLWKPFGNQSAAGGRRGFALSALHFYRVFQQDDMRRLLLNAAVWLAGVALPPGSISTPRPSGEEMMANQEGEIPPGFSEETARSLIRPER